jgi:Cof subfamily protein (haloacid dehalogenase superfamily)
MSSATNMHPDIRVVIADIDGTLVTKDKLLTADSIHAATLLQQAGITFGVTTGRPPKGVRMLVDPLPNLRFIAGFNGGVIVSRDFSVFAENLLSADIAKQVVQIILQHSMDVWLYTDKDWFIRDSQAYRVVREQATVQFAPTLINTFAGTIEHVAKIVGVSQQHDVVARCERYVQEAFGAEVSAARSQPFYLDVTHPKANKGEVVHLAASFFNVSPRQIATIGDMANDISMFKTSGMSIAMGNASPEVQEAATFVTASNQAEGFAKAVTDFILPKEGASAA